MNRNMFMFGVVLVLVAGGMVVWAILDREDSAEVFADSKTVIEPSDGEAESGSIATDTNAYTVEASYPVDESPSVAIYIQEQTEKFQEQAQSAYNEKSESMPWRQHALSIEYQVHEVQGYTSYVVDEYHYTGGASGIQLIETFVFDPDGRELALGDVVPAGRREALLAAVRAHLYAVNGLDPSAVGPFAESIDSLQFGNLEQFFLAENELVIGFQEYDVAPGAAGAVRVRLPLQAYTSL